MSKIRITDNEKIKAIESYIQGERSFAEIRNKYGVPKSTFTIGYTDTKPSVQMDCCAESTMILILRGSRNRLQRNIWREKAPIKISATNTKFIQLHNYETGSGCIVVIENYGPAGAEGVISI